jgi:hypothetical protein
MYGREDGEGVAKDSTCAEATEATVSRTGDGSTAAGGSSAQDTVVGLSIGLAMIDV